MFSRFWTWERGSVSRGIVLESNSVTVELVFSVPWLRVDFKTVCPSTLWHDGCIRAWGHLHKWACSKTFANICRLSENSATEWFRFIFLLWNRPPLPVTFVWSYCSPLTYCGHTCTVSIFCFALSVSTSLYLFSVNMDACMCRVCVCACDIWKRERRGRVPQLFGVVEEGWCW
jgi:hypothetical protein